MFFPAEVKIYHLLASIMKIAILMSVLLLLADSSFGQWYNRYYENKELSALNAQELSFLLDKTGNTKKTGMILTISGITSSVLGSTILIFMAIDDIFSAMSTGETSHSMFYYHLTTAMMIAGPFVMAGGITVWIIGAHRHREIRKAMNNITTDASLYITPIMQFSSIQNPCTVGLSISLRF